MQRFRSYFLFILGQLSHIVLCPVELYILTAWFAPSCFIFQQYHLVVFQHNSFQQVSVSFSNNQPLWKKDETKMKNSNGSALTYKIAPRTLKTFTRYVLSSFTLSNLELEKLHCQKQNAPTEKIKKKKKGDRKQKLSIKVAYL